MSFITWIMLLQDFPGGSDGNESACNAGDLGLIPGLRRSPGEGKGDPLQCSCLENPQVQRYLVGYSPWGHQEQFFQFLLICNIHVKSLPLSTARTEKGKVAKKSLYSQSPQYEMERSSSQLLFTELELGQPRCIFPF